MSPRRRLTLLLFALLLVLLAGVAAALWQWKAAALVQRRLEQWTHHRVSVGAVSINHRLEIVVRDIRVAGAPPFEGQTLAFVPRAVVRLRGAAGFWSPSEVEVDGLDLDYLGTSAGDNLRVSPPPGGAASPAGPRAPVVAWPRIVLRHGRLRGSLALPHAPRLDLRVPEAEVERAVDGTWQATLRRSVVDVHGWASLRASVLTVRSPGKESAASAWTLSSAGGISVEIPGGGTFLDKLTLAATVGHGSANAEVRAGDEAGAPPLLALHARPTSLDIAVDASALDLRSLAALGAKSGLGLEHAQASLNATVAVDRTALQGTFTLRGQLSGVDVLHAAVDTAAWRNQSLAVDASGTAEVATGRVELAAATIKALGATLAVKGWIETTSPPRGAWVVQTARQAPLACAALLRAQPEPVKRALAGLELGGALGLLVSLDFNAGNWDDLRLGIDVQPRCSVLHEPAALADLLPILTKPKSEPPPSAKLPLGPYHPDFTPLAEMPAHLPLAFITAEDSKFYRHRGFDVEMIQHVLAQDLENRSFDRGASTITQQLAKNLFLSHRRTLARKLEEAVLTWRLQRLLRKDRTLELYLNVIELGPGIRGVKQAAERYFGKPVRELLPLESAHLAALTPNPHVLARRFQDGQIDESWQQRLYDLLGMMKRHGRLTPEELARARATKLELKRL